MNRATAAVLIALAFTAGNIAATSAGNIRLKPLQGTVQPTGPMNFKNKPFPANCVSGFQKYDEQKVMEAGVPVVHKYRCRTAWIECPNFPVFAETWLEYEVEDQATGNEGKRIRFKYLCQGVDIEG